MKEEKANSFFSTRDSSLPLDPSSNHPSPKYLEPLEPLWGEAFQGLTPPPDQKGVEHFDEYATTFDNDTRDRARSRYNPIDFRRIPQNFQGHNHRQPPTPPGPNLSPSPPGSIISDSSSAVFEFGQEQPSPESNATSPGSTGYSRHVKMSDDEDLDGLFHTNGDSAANAFSPDPASRKSFDMSRFDANSGTSINGDILMDLEGTNQNGHFDAEGMESEFFDFDSAGSPAVNIQGSNSAQLLQSTSMQYTANFNQALMNNAHTNGGLQNFSENYTEQKFQGAGNDVNNHGDEGMTKKRRIGRHGRDDSNGSAMIVDSPIFANPNKYPISPATSRHHTTSRNGSRSGTTSPGGPGSAWEFGFSMPVAGLSQQKQFARKFGGNNSISSYALQLPFSPPLNLSSEGAQQRADFPMMLSFGRLPVKSRVETQVTLELYLNPFPRGVTKIHLPRHSISKTKLLARPPVEKSPDMLELCTSLVCASAMESPENLKRALNRAIEESSREYPYQPLKTESTQEGVDASSGDDSDSPGATKGKSVTDDEGPLLGGEVKICQGCIVRERKRAARKKLKKVEEETEWMRDEHRRVIVFNTNEIREWAPAIRKKKMDEEPRWMLEKGIPSGTMMIEAPMRIACYCRHQAEKSGFRVIFTIKDHNDKVLAQSITGPILITDDHKTNSTSPEPGFNNVTMSPPVYHTPAMSFPQQSQPGTRGPTPEAKPHQISPHTSFLPSPTSQYGRPELSIPSNGSAPGPISPVGSSSKKRKANGHINKIPQGLTMTRINGDSSYSNQFPGTSAPVPMPLNLMNTVPSYQPAFPSYTGDLNLQMNNNHSRQHLQWQHVPTATPLNDPRGDDQAFTFDSNGVQRTDNRNYANNHPFSSPNSTTHSRAPSPSPNKHFHQIRMPTSVTHFPGQFQIPPNVFPNTRQQIQQQQSIPQISRIVPGEGPCIGGIEVTVLGSGFVDGLIVVFGDNPATQNTRFSDSTMICVLPPHVAPGPVVVTLRDIALPMSRENVRFFTYVDDADKSLMELALRVVGLKMNRNLDSAKDVALKILQNNHLLNSAGVENGGQGGNQRRHLESLAGLGFTQNESLETSLLKCLDFIDLDDSPNPPRLWLQNRSGQTMLHLSCILGMQRFTAALLARSVPLNLQDRNGYTALHFAACYDRPEIIKRLLLNGADPHVLTMNMETARQLAVSEEVKRLLPMPQLSYSRHHSRNNSCTSERVFGSKTRSSSAGSIRSIRSFGNMRRPKMFNGKYEGYGSSDEAVSSDPEDEQGSNWISSRRSSQHELAVAAAMANAGVPMQNNESGDSSNDASANPNAAMSPAAMMTAWREQITASFQQHLQALQWMAAPADYQQMFNRFQNPMAKFNVFMPPSAQHEQRVEEESKQQQHLEQGQYKWKELFVNPPPPAYDELYPQGGSSSGVDTLLARGAAVDDVDLDSKARERAISVASSSRSVSPNIDLDELQRKIAHGGRDFTKEQQEEYRAHVRKMKKIESDRRLYFFWLPMFVFILMFMITSWGPKIYSGAKLMLDFASQTIKDPRSVKEGLRMIAGRAAGAIRGGLER
ncbi:SPT3 Dosage dependent suppressor of Ty-induced promoter mutations-like protein [Rhizina undulata]